MNALIQLVFVVALFCSVEAEVKAPDQILKTLQSGHPRLLIDHTTIPDIQKLIATDAVAGRVYKRIRREADKILKQGPSKYRIPDGRRLLSTSRRVKERVRTLAFVYLMEGGGPYLDRIWAELETAADFKDWNPSHFLDTAEMTHAFAIGYDWLYGAWTETQRKTLENAIRTLGLKPGLDAYRDRVWWARNQNNWNQVCNGGLGMGALAIADVDMDQAAQILHHAIKSIPRAMAHYAPDGAGIEGVTYWSYGVRYNVLFLAALKSALGTDFGLSQIDGFQKSGHYQIYISGADRRAFNFADSGDGRARMSTPMHFWMRQQYDLPQYSWFRYDTLQKYGYRGNVLDLLWFDGTAQDFDVTTLPLDRHFREAECASIRSSWDPDALVLGIQAGDNHNLGSHRHLDLGSFILEAQGERWVIDSGTERETYQRHRNKEKRWAFYRIRAEGHNTLVFNSGDGPDQNPKAVAPITLFESRPQRSIAVVDLSQAYAEHAKSVQRTFEMHDRRFVTITDEIETRASADLWWFMHTEAAVLSAEGKAATLGQNGKQLTVQILTPEGAVFRVMDAAPLPTSPAPSQADNTGRRKLAIRLNGVTHLKLSVKLMPVQGGQDDS